MGGVTVRNATLHNEHQLMRVLGLRQGDLVEIQRAGDVIPEVDRALPEEGREAREVIRYPEVCPVCGAGLVREPNPKDPDKVLIQPVITLARVPLVDSPKTADIKVIEGPNGQRFRRRCGEEAPPGSGHRCRKAARISIPWERTRGGRRTGDSPARTARTVSALAGSFSDSALTARAKAVHGMAQDHRRSSGRP